MFFAESFGISASTFSMTFHKSSAGLVYFCCLTRTTVI